ncbi:MAG: hypothetical protein U5R06_09710 [candidate division KSB1 bacterium]|nr:hypothetical protein [candidate division KSB1 bacterium]
MAMQLNNDQVKLELCEPGEVYRGMRFDWTGQIEQITYKGGEPYTFCTREIPDAPLTRQGFGLVNEFGIDQALGYRDCPVGEQFHKIGVGLLTRDTHESYDFFRDYPVQPYEFKVSAVSDTRSVFTCEAAEHRGYQFKLEKQIELAGAGFSIQYTFTNSGKKHIRTNEYVHNFLAVNEQEIGSNYTLRFSFPIDPKRFHANVNPEAAVQFDANQVFWKKTPEQQFYVANVGGAPQSGASWTLVFDNAIRIREQVDFQTTVNLWGHSHVVSPEFFFELDAAPGEQVTWQRRYDILPETGKKS